MQISKTFPPILLSLGLLLGCAQSYQPIVDLKGVNTTKYQQDLAECRQYAEQVDVGGNTAIGTLGGAGIGAAVGAAAGAIGGNAGAGAATGALLGGVGGAGAGVGTSVQRQKTVINKCLSHRGYKVLE
jgi:outer membrane lipoprotein SlyB